MARVERESAAGAATRSDHHGAKEGQCPGAGPLRDTATPIPHAHRMPDPRSFCGCARRADLDGSFRVQAGGSTRRPIGKGSLTVTSL